MTTILIFIPIALEILRHGRSHHKLAFDLIPVLVKPDEIRNENFLKDFNPAFTKYYK